MNNNIYKFNGDKKRQGEAKKKETMTEKILKVSILI